MRGGQIQIALRVCPRQQPGRRREGIAVRGFSCGLKISKSEWLIFSPEAALAPCRYGAAARKGKHRTPSRQELFPFRAL